jgi:hypothetical protein
MTDPTHTLPDEGDRAFARLIVGRLLELVPAPSERCRNSAVRQVIAEIAADDGRPEVLNQLRERGLLDHEGDA